MNPTILIVDDDDSLRRVLEFNLAEEGYAVLSAARGDEGLRLALEHHPQVILTDLKMPGLNGIDLLEAVKKELPDTPVIMITAYGSIEGAVKAMQLGAAQYLTKPFNRDELKLVVRRLLEAQNLRVENRRLKEQVREQEAFGRLVGESAPWKRVLEELRLVAPAEAHVLIQGESGTGKELAARAIHELSPRRAKPFVALNCTAIPRDLLESELFGHVRGAFTGAQRDKTGKFEEADGGTLFLDEIGDMDLELQPKLLRVIEQQEVERVGEGRPRKIDVRIVAATHRNLEENMAQGRFREDLYFRISVFTLRLPPLRERTEDIPFLLKHFGKKYAPGGILRFSPEALNAMLNHSWKGNVRELLNQVQRLSILAANREVAVTDLSWASLPSPARSGKSVVLPPEGHPLDDIVREAIAQALEYTGGNQSRAARLLGIPRHILLYRMKQVGMEARDSGG